MPEWLEFLLLTVVIFAVITVSTTLARNGRLLSILREIELVMVYETDFIRLAKDEVERLEEEGMTFEEAWDEAMEKYFHQNFRWAIHELTGDVENAPIDPRVARYYLDQRLHDRVLQAMLPDIVPEV